VVGEGNVYMKEREKGRGGMMMGHIKGMGKEMILPAIFSP
jgi:hypothetical protein